MFFPVFSALLAVKLFVRSRKFGRCENDTISSFTMMSMVGLGLHTPLGAIKS